MMATPALYGRERIWVGQKFTTLRFGTYTKTVPVVEHGRSQHGHCIKCGACLLMHARQHRCVLKWKMPWKRGTKDLFWMKPREDAPRGIKTFDPKAQYNGFPLAKVLRLADRYYRPLRPEEVKAVRQYEDHRLRNLDLSERRGEPPRPVLSAIKETYDCRAWSVNPVTGARKLISTTTTRTVEKRAVTVTSHAQATAAFTGDDGDDPELEYSMREKTFSRGHDAEKAFSLDDDWATMFSRDHDMESQ